MSKRTIRVLVAEQRLGQRPGQLGLAHPGRAEEQERADRPVRVAEPGPWPAHRLGDRLDRLVLADDPLVQRSSSRSSRSRSSSVSWDTGMPVARETTSAMSSA